MTLLSDKNSMYSKKGTPNFPLNLDFLGKFIY
jgi:hypothetical protein